MFHNIEKTRSPEIILSRELDLPILYFLWKWKISTTAQMSQYFSDSSSINGIYQRLLRLERADYIQSHTNRTAKYFLWTLAKRGYAIIQPDLPSLREDGFMSENLGHDLFTSAIHLGDGVFGKIPHLKYFSEQQLRRIEPEFYPEWVPKTTRRRSDGYWCVEQESSQRIISLEVELTQKSEDRYESIGRFYDDHLEIDQILWVVARPSLMGKIQTLLEKSSSGAFRHSFVELQPIYQDGWRAKISSGFMLGKTIAELLQTQPRSIPGLILSQVSFDGRKSPHKSKHCQLLEPTSFSD